MSQDPAPNANCEINIASFSINSFLDLTPQQRRDATYTTLFARLATTKSVDPRAAPAQWTQTFISNLEQINYVVTSSTITTSTLQSGQVDSLVLAALENQTGWSKHEYALAVRAMYAIGMAGRGSLVHTTFDAAAISSSKKAFMFQIAIADVANGNIRLQLLSFSLEMQDTQSQIDRVFGYSWSGSSAQWTVRELTAELNGQLYDIARAALEQRLADAGAINKIVGVTF